MRNLMFATVGISVLFLLLQTAKADEWDDAAKAIKHLSPRVLHDLPASVSDELVKQGCTIPQQSFYETKKRMSVISGSFAKRGQKDYAILCSKNGVSHIQLFWGGAAHCASSLASMDDRVYLQTAGQGRIAYSRAIGIVPPRAIEEAQSEPDSPKSSDASHDGISDAFAGKASEIYYCAKGKWTVLDGAD